MFRFFRRKRADKQTEDTQVVVDDSLQTTDQSSTEETEISVLPADEPITEEPTIQAVSDVAPVSVAQPKSQPKPEPQLESQPQSSLVAESSEPVSVEVAEPLEASSSVKSDSTSEDVTPAILEQSPPSEQTSAKKSWMSRLRQGLSRTGRSIGGIFVGSRIEESLYEDLESALIMADAGVQASVELIAKLRKEVGRRRLQTPQEVRQALVDVLTEHLTCLEKPFDVGHVQPLVMMIAGVNGAGKTTSIGKLAFSLQKSNQKVLLAAGDTFRAAAREQLVAWGERNNVAVIAQTGGDPAAVAFDAVHAGHARGMDVVMVDTAGRLPTQLHLMEELKKIARVIRKADEQAPHEVLLVVDGNTGQNALAQVKAFDEALTLTGLVVTKLDGTAKGGVLAALAAGAQGCRPIPVYWVGVGEQIEDLQPFVAREFAQALVGDGSSV